MSRNSDLTPFILLYAAMYAAYGVASPFLPAYVNARGIPAGELGLVLGAGTAMRLVSVAFVGRLADFLQALRTTLVVCVALASVVTLFYLPAHGFSAFFAVSLVQALTLAPMTVLADALTLGNARRAGFEYGWVRGTGSAAFIVATLVSGQFVAASGLKAAVVAQSLLLIVAALLRWIGKSSVAAISLAVFSLTHATVEAVLGLMTFMDR